MPKDTLDNLTPLDAATKARLSQLRAIPVDLSRLSRSIAEEIPKPAMGGIPFARRWFARAAVIFLLVGAGVLGVALFGSGGRAMASPDDLAKLHAQVTSGQGMSVDSIEAACRALCCEPGALPASTGDHVMACCHYQIGKTQACCIAFRSGDEAMSLAVGGARDIRSPRGPTVQRNGVSYHVYSSNGVNMIMSDANGKWVCIMGTAPVEKLLSAAGQVRW